jgi:hypothetical protein
MPFAPDTPTSVDKEVVTPTPQDLDELHVHELHIVLVPNDPSATRVRVKWSEGYDDSGTYRPHEIRSDTFEGGNLVTEMTASCDAANDRFEEIKKAVWSLLQAEGKVGAGTVS